VRGASPPPRPAGIRVERAAEVADGSASIFAYRDSARSRPQGTLRLTRIWRSPRVFFLLAFCLFWDSFLVLWYAIAFSAPHFSLLMVLFPLLHVVVGVVLTYSTLARLINRTVIEVDAERVRVRHGPLPWRKGRILSTRGIRKLDVRLAGRPRSGAGCAVHATFEDRSSVALVEGLPDLADARFIEWAVEDFLDLDNDPDSDRG